MKTQLVYLFASFAAVLSAAAGAQAAGRAPEACQTSDVACAPQGAGESEADFCARIVAAKSAGNAGYATSYCHFDSYGRLTGFSTRFVPRAERVKVDPRSSSFGHANIGTHATLIADHPEIAEVAGGAPIAETVSGVVKLGLLAGRAVGVTQCLPKGLVNIPSDARAGAIAFETLNSAITAVGLIGAVHEYAGLETDPFRAAEPNPEDTELPGNTVEVVRGDDGVWRRPEEELGSRFGLARERLSRRQPELAATLESVKAEVARGDVNAGRKIMAIEQAHRVGEGRAGAYTPAELAAKVRILLSAGFSRAEREAILRSGLAGEATRVGNAPELETESLASIATDLDALKAKEAELEPRPVTLAPNPKALGYDDYVESLADQLARYILDVRAGRNPTPSNDILILQGDISALRRMLDSDAERAIGLYRQDLVTLGCAMGATATCLGGAATLISMFHAPQMIPAAIAGTLFSAFATAAGVNHAANEKLDGKFWARLAANGLDVPKKGRSEWLSRALRDEGRREDKLASEAVAGEIDRYRGTLENLAQLMQAARRPAARELLESMARQLPKTHGLKRSLFTNLWRKDSIAALTKSKQRLRDIAPELGLQELRIDLDALLDPPVVHLATLDDHSAEVLSFIEPTDTMSRTVLLKAADAALHEHLTGLEGAKISFDAQLVPVVGVRPDFPVGLSRLEAVLTVKKDGHTIGIPIATEFSTRYQIGTSMIHGDEWLAGFRQAFHKAVDESPELRALAAR